jgi:RNA polymerase sigma factor (TIGR02999 family)
MKASRRTDINKLLAGIDRDNRAAIVERLMPLVYDELRGVAARYLRGERAGHTLQPTALVHEAFLKLADQSRIDWKGRTHFCAVAANVMRRLLVDHARARKRRKRGGGRAVRELAEEAVPAELSESEVLDLHDAIERLAKLDERQARVVELRFFGGLNMEEVAEALGVSKRTVEDDWTHAKAWLRVEFGQGAEP